MKYILQNPSPYRFVRKAVKPSIQAINRARGVYDGVSMLLVGISEGVRGPIILGDSK